MRLGDRLEKSHSVSVIQVLSMQASLLKLITQESSIHGFRHITDGRRNNISKFFWFCFASASIGLLFLSGYNLYVKFQVEPEIGLRVNQKAMNELPYPAVTICSPLFARDNLVNATKAFDAYRAKIPIELNSREQNYFAANSHGCAPQLMKFFVESCKNRTDFNTMKLIKESSLGVDEMLKSCNFRGAPWPCARLFARSLTDYGYCFTYNMQNHNDIFNEDVISPDFDVFKKSNQIGANLSAHWTLFGNYVAKKNQTMFFPVRALKFNIITFYTYLNETDSANVCQGTGKVFPIILHMPNETPTPFHEEIYLEYDRRKTITVVVKTYKSTEDLRKFSPEKRGCYFDDERQLKFYKSYTKSHCDFECMTNYTLKECGCVKFSMPRTKGTPVCDIDKGDCYYNAMLQWPKDEENSHRPCNCLDTCSILKYSVLYEKDSVLNDFTGPSPIGDMKRFEIIENYSFLCPFKIVLFSGTYSFFTIRTRNHAIDEYETFAAYRLQNCERI
jgi:amiloride-sensitive sodium channel